MSQPEFPANSVVQACRDGEVHFIGEFISCDGLRITLRIMGPRNARILESFELAGYELECWDDLKGEVGIAFLRLMDEDDDWCERDFFQKFEPRELEILFLDGDVRIRDDAAERIPEARLAELILEQDDHNAAVEALEHIKSEELLKRLAGTNERHWDLEDAEANDLRVRALRRYEAFQKPSEAADIETAEPVSRPPPQRKKGELPSTYIEKQERLKASAAEADQAKERSRPWWKLW